MSEQTVDVVETVEDATLDQATDVEVVEPVDVVEEPEEDIEEEEEVVESKEGKTDYILHITSSDSLGLNLIENIIAMANLGATLKPQTLPSMRFPHSCSMILTADHPPTPSAVIRVFEADTNKEIFKAFAEKAPATFSMESVDTEDKTTNDGTPWTKEQLDAMEWDQLKEICKSVGLSGRDRKKLTKQFMDKMSK